MILALDIGSSSARATLYDEAAAVVEGGAAQVAYHTRVTADGGVELDAVPLLAAAAECIDRVLPRARDVAAVGLSTFWHGLLGFDAAGQPATPLYMYSDTRSAGEAEALSRRLDEAAVRARTGCPLHTSYWPAKLRWLAARAPAVRAARWGSIGEWLAAQWLGHGVTSISTASGTGLFDQERRAWDPEMLEVAGIDEGQLFPLVDLDQGLTLREPWASRWPALRRAVWYPAIGDGAAGSVGSGCTDRTRVAINVGTSSAMRLVTDAAPPVPPWGLWRYRLDARRSIAGGSLSEGGDVYAWCAGALVLGAPDAVERALVAEADVEHGLTVLPLLAGERSPGWSPRARGAIAGLSLATTALDILRASLESVALRLALIYDLLAPLAAPGHQIVASGGALVRSAAWVQMIADALGRPLVLAREREASSRGAALLAAAALGRGGALEAAPLDGARVEPHAARHRRFGELRARQARLYAALVGGGGAPGPRSAASLPRPDLPG
jgi:gluconokinase